MWALRREHVAGRFAPGRSWQAHHKSSLLGMVAFLRRLEASKLSFNWWEVPPELTGTWSDFSVVNIRHQAMALPQGYCTACQVLRSFVHLIFTFDSSSNLRQWILHLLVWYWTTKYKYMCIGKTPKNYSGWSIIQVWALSPWCSDPTSSWICSRRQQDGPGNNSGKWGGISRC